MHPTIVRFGPLSIHSYGLMIAIGFGLALVLMYRLAKKEGLPAGRLMDMAFWAALAGIIGSRLIYVVTRWDEFMVPLFTRGDLRIFKIWEGGLTFYGGLIGGIIVGLLLVRRWRIPLLPVMDIAGPAVALGQAVGRIGCFLAGCCWGKPSYLPWAISFPSKSIVFSAEFNLYHVANRLENLINGLAASVNHNAAAAYGAVADHLAGFFQQIWNPNLYLTPYLNVLERTEDGGTLSQWAAQLGQIKAQAGAYFAQTPGLAQLQSTVPIHPTQAYLSLSLFLIFGILMILRRFRRFYGQVFFSYTLLHATLRLLMEPIRGDIVPRPIGLGVLSETQVVAIGLIVVSVVMLIVLGWRSRKKGRTAAAGA